MASIINAATSGGLITTADTSGNLQLQTAGTTALTISSAQAITMAGRTTNPTTISVGNATPSTSGAGISFPATQSTSSDANTLDDYEEGTFSPTITFASGSVGITYSQQQGKYVKIGDNVFINIYMILSSKGSSTGQLSMESFPFACIGSFNAFAPLAPRGLINTGGSPVSLYANGGTSFPGYICNLTGGSNSNLNDTAISNNSEFNFNFWYRTT